jgi:peptidyl-prolyl cis-trans isomerase B (cyclophilin B)
MSKRKVYIGLIILLALGFYLYQLRANRPLPTGQISQDLQISPSPIVTPAAIPTHPQVQISTTKGTFTVELRPDIAPQSAINFLTKWSNGYCDGLTFHRVEDWVVQGCDPAGDGTGGQLILSTETSSNTFTRGSLGVARLAYPKDKSNDSQFFIVKKDSTFLDGEYTYLGKVLSGMSVVDSLSPQDTITQTTILTK